MMRLPVPIGFSGWWDSTLPTTPLRLSLRWRGGQSLELGALHRERMLLEFAPDPEDFTDTKSAERVGRMVAKALTRAGWRRPAVDPSAMLRLLDLRRGMERLEFILDTNALVEGIAHWLVDHFADRCDLVITAVTLRELQDAQGRAGFGKELHKKLDKRTDTLAARQLYLSAHRLRERTGYPRVLWRELEVDDTALLLSRGHGSDKTSESDTLLLRAVRRSIHDRVNNLERFFVTGDTALARRAATELPSGSVLAAQVQPVDKGEVLFPCSWWPGPDQGLRVVRHPARLVWELLCVADEVVLKDGKDREWAFKAFGNPMWPSDYLEPWVEVVEPTPSATHPVPTSAHDPQSQRDDDASDLQTPNVVEGHEAPRVPDPAGNPVSFWAPVPEGAPTLEDNLRLPAQATMDLLAAIATAAGDSVTVPSSVYETSVSRHHVRRFVEGLRLGTVDDDVEIITFAEARPDLANAWSRNDLDAVFDIVRRWKALEEWATLHEPPKRPRHTLQAARALASLLGQGRYHPETRRWLPGGRRPSPEEMRQSVIEAASEHERKTLPVYRLLVDVFLGGLGVSPIRVSRRWKDLWAAGVFEGFEAREGGSSSGRHYQEYAELGPTGWSARRLDLESLAGTRDLVFKGTP